MTTFALKQVGPFAIDVDGGSWKLRMDLAPGQGGGGSGPGPTDLVPIAVAACEMMLALLTAKKLGHPLADVEATVTKTYRTNPSRLGDMDVTLRNVLSQLDPQLHEKIKAAVATCPVVKTLEQPPAVHSQIE